MASAILYLHLALALLLLLCLWKASGIWLRMGAVVAVLQLTTGIYNFLTRMTDPPPGWHAGIGIKILLALHVIVVSFVMSRGGDPQKLARLRKGALISATIVILTGLYFSNIAR